MGLLKSWAPSIANGSNRQLGQRSHPHASRLDDGEIPRPIRATLDRVENHAIGCRSIAGKPAEYYATFRGKTETKRELAKILVVGDNNPLLGNGVIEDH